jgi:hypothetical protein
MASTAPHIDSLLRVAVALSVADQVKLVRAIAASREWFGTEPGYALADGANAMAEELREQAAAESGASDPYFAGVGRVSGMVLA